MSAFVCSRETFVQLAAYVTRPRGGSGPILDPRYLAYCGQHGQQAAQLCNGMRGAEFATAIARLLYWENVRSVGCRYANDTCECDPPAVDFYDIEQASGIPAVDVLKMAQCLEYQSCESDDWESTLAYGVLQRLRSAAISSLPGYESAAWGHNARAAINAQACRARRAA